MAPIDPGEAAYTQLLPRLTAIAADRVVQPRTDVRAAATFVLSEVAGRLKDGTLLARFASLPSAEFDHSALADLIGAAQAARWAQTQLADSRVSDTEARLPLELLQQSSAQRERMLDLCTYHFKGDSTIRPQVEDIRAGQGYLDLGEDLSRLAALYTTHHALLEQDLRFYRATDAADALALAQRITTELRMQPGRAQTARELAWRTWALLQELYNEVAHAGRFLLRHEGEVAFPLLHTAGRVSLRRSTTRPAADAAAPAAKVGPTS